MGSHLVAIMMYKIIYDYEHYRTKMHQLKDLCRFVDVVCRNPNNVFDEEFWKEKEESIKEQLGCICDEMNGMHRFNLSKYNADGKRIADLEIRMIPQYLMERIKSRLLIEEILRDTIENNSKNLGL